METRQLAFRGVPYFIACEPGDWHPTWFTYEDEAVVRDRDWLISPGQFVLDIGAAFGSYTLTALSQGAAHVWSWAPQGMELSEEHYLKASLALNGWQDRCTVLTTGLYDRDGWLNTDTQAFHEQDPGPDRAIIRVETLDEWHARAQPARIDWMKLDVEGAELRLLKGGEATIRKHLPTILVENHEFKDSTLLPGIREFLPSLGYSELRTVQHHGVSHSVWLPTYPSKFASPAA